MKYSNVFYHRTLSGTQDENSSSQTRITKTILIGIVGLWFLAAFIGGMMDIFYQLGVPPVTVGLFLLIPVVVFTLAYVFSTRVQHAIDRIPLWLITIAHVWRFVGIGFVIGAVMRVLPSQFGFPEGLGDVVAALLCLPLAFAIRRGRRSTGLRRAFIAWNVYGLIDLLSAISLGILYSPSSFGVLRTDLSTEVMTAFPVNLIPTFFLPLFILLHMLSLKRSRELARAPK
jgi:hypothetical protein